MTQPVVARGAPQTDAEMIAALEQHIENYRIACEGFEHGARVAAYRIAELEQENAALKAERDDLLETLTDVTNQACRMSDGTLDSMALSANASAMHTLADHGVIVIDADYGRRVIGHYPEVKA